LHLGLIIPNNFYCCRYFKQGNYRTD